MSTCMSVLSTKFYICRISEDSLSLEEGAMPTQVICRTCGAEWSDSDVSCPACGFQNPPLTEAEDLIASWVIDSPIPLESQSAAQDAVCISCGYEGPMIPSPGGDRVLCPACSNPWQDQGGIRRKALCPDCGQVLLLTEQHRGKTIICPRCHSLLGCLINRESRRTGRRSTILDIMAITVAFALGYSVALRLWEEHIPGLILHGISVVVLSITWMLVALRVLGPRSSRRRLFYPPGLAACLAVSTASLFSLCYGWDQPYSSFPSPQGILSIAALRAVQPLPLAAAVAGTWLVLMFDRRWRPEPSWIDRTARGLAVYWLALAATVTFLRLFSA